MLLSLVFLLGCAVTSGFSSSWPCNTYRSVSKKVNMCITDFPNWLYSDEEIIHPEVIRLLSIQPCKTREATDQCLPHALNQCPEKVDTITGYLEDVRPLCNGSNLVDWFEDALQSSVPVPQECFRQLLFTGMEICFAHGKPVPSYGYLDESVLMSREFFTAAVECTLTNMHTMYAAAPTCAGVDVRRAIFSAAFFINALPGDLFTMHFSEADVLQIKAGLLPFD